MTFDNRPVKRPPENTSKTASAGAAKPGTQRTTPKSTGAIRTGQRTASSTTARRPASAAGARPASSSGRKPAPRAGRPSGQTAARRPAPGRRAPAKGSRKPAWLSKRVGRFDMETVLAMALILVVLVAIGFAIGGIVSAVNKKNTDYVQKTEIANIVPEVTATAVTQTSLNNAVDIFGTPTVPPETGTQTQTNVGTQPSQIASVGTPNSGGLRSCTIRTVGDFVMDKNILAAGKAYSQSTSSQYKYDFSGMLSIISEYMGNADFTVANVDGSMGGESHYRYGYSGYPQFNTPEMLIYNVKDAGVDMLTLANNHMLDGWFDGLMDEIENVEKAGLYHVGANRSTEEKNTPVIIEINGIKVGFLNYTESLNSMETRGVDPKATVFGVNSTRNSNCGEDAKRLREAGADVIVCYMHWGEEYVTTPNKNQTDMVQKLMKAGVDIIVGGHPHVVQHAEWITGTNQFGEAQRTFCIYSLGNFLSEHTIKNTDGGIIFEFTIQEKGDGTFEITAPGYLTTYVWKTGDDIFGRGYVVVPCAAYINSGTRPSGMSNSEYNAMVASHNNQVAIMNEGVGTQITR
ncbi:MAG: CapA family protein [Clostridia bacterium]|nr:CapA family protein [Clostridia bacterium]